jgi:hypothetical protein
VAVVGAWLGQAGHTVVAVPQDLDAQTVVLLRQVVEASEQLVQQLHQLLGRALRGQQREPADVRKQNTATGKIKYEKITLKSKLPQMSANRILQCPNKHEKKKIKSKIYNCNILTIKEVPNWVNTAT